MAEMPWRAGGPLPQLAEAGSHAESCPRPCWSRDICLDGAAAPLEGQHKAQLATATSTAVFKKSGSRRLVATDSD